MSTQLLEIKGEDFRYRSLGERAAAVFREKIISGEFAPGMRLTEEGFAKAIDISRSCIREAFGILEREGLVVRRVRNKYTEVVKLNAQDIEEIFSLRYALEVLAAETCIRKGFAPIGELRGLVARIVELAESNDRNFSDYVEIDFKLHEAILVSSMNRRAIEVWRGLESQTRMLMFSVIRENPDLIELRSVGRHLDLVRAFESGDVKVVTAILREHILGNVSLLIQHIGENNECVRQDFTGRET